MTDRQFKKTFQITQAKIQAFAECTGDFNPVHLNETYALKTKFGRCIAHGMYSAGLISSVLGNDFPGQGTIYVSQSLHFKAPVFTDDTITVTVSVIEVYDNGTIKLGTVCTNSLDKTVLQGEAVVIPPANFLK